MNILKTIGIGLLFVTGALLIVPLIIKTAIVVLSVEGVYRIVKNQKNNRGIVTKNNYTII